MRTASSSDVASNGAFRRLFDALPERVQHQADTAYGLFEQNPKHPSLHLKRVSERQPVYSVRIGRHYRAIASHEGNVWLWIWIGTHAEYDQILRGL